MGDPSINDTPSDAVDFMFPNNEVKIVSNSESPASEVAERVGDLPMLPPGYMRCVHITNELWAKEIAEKGLDYEKYGMLSSTARWWADPLAVEYYSDDSRFSFAGAKAVVLDIPADECKLHNDVAKSPGLVPAKYVVGIVDAIKPNSQQ